MLFRSGELNKVVCFQYQRMMRYGGKWHLENRMLIPGHIFLSGSELLSQNNMGGHKENIVSLILCERPYLNELCQEGNIVGISRGIIQNGRPVVTSGPLKKREAMIRRIDRHKRTAKIEIPFVGGRKQVTVGLEIYDKFQAMESI